eukprot:273480_1
MAANETKTDDTPPNTNTTTTKPAQTAITIDENENETKETTAQTQFLASIRLPSFCNKYRLWCKENKDNLSEQEYSNYLQQYAMVTILYTRMMTDTSDIMKLRLEIFSYGSLPQAVMDGMMPDELKQFAEDVGKPLLTFSEDVGCTIYDIATVFKDRSYNDKDNLWKKLVNTKTELTDFVGIYTITMAVMAMALKSKNNFNKPPQWAIILLTKQLITKLPKNVHSQPLLEKEEYFNLHSILYKMHEEMTDDNPRSKPYSKIVYNTESKTSQVTCDNYHPLQYFSFSDLIKSGSRYISCRACRTKDLKECVYYCKHCRYYLCFNCYNKRKNDPLYGRVVWIDDEKTPYNNKADKHLWSQIEYSISFFPEKKKKKKKKKNKSKKKKKSIEL